MNGKRKTGELIPPAFKACPANNRSPPFILHNYRVTYNRKSCI